MSVPFGELVNTYPWLAGDLSAYTADEEAAAPQYETPPMAQPTAPHESYLDRFAAGLTGVQLPYFYGRHAGAGNLVAGLMRGFAATRGGRVLERRNRYEQDQTRYEQNQEQRRREASAAGTRLAQHRWDLVRRMAEIQAMQNAGAYDRGQPPEPEIVLPPDIAEFQRLPAGATMRRSDYMRTVEQMRQDRHRRVTESHADEPPPPSVTQWWKPSEEAADKAVSGLLTEKKALPDTVMLSPSKRGPARKQYAEIDRRLGGATRNAHETRVRNYMQRMEKATTLDELQAIEGEIAIGSALESDERIGNAYQQARSRLARAKPR